jgi:ubiquitin-activating enzyme E1
LYTLLQGDTTAAAGGGSSSSSSSGASSFMVDVDAQCQQLTDALPKPASLAGFCLHGIDFDKDIDAHMALVTAASNLRARCYKIPEADMHQSRLIAGKVSSCTLIIITNSSACSTGLLLL